MQSMGNKNSTMLATPLVLTQTFSKRMLVDWPKCGSDPRDEGHLACLVKQQVDFNPGTFCYFLTGLTYNLYL